MGIVDGEGVAPVKELRSWLKDSGSLLRKLKTLGDWNTAKKFEVRSLQLKDLLSVLRKTDGSSKLEKSKRSQLAILLSNAKSTMINRHPKVPSSGS